METLVRAAKAAQTATREQNERLRLRTMLRSGSGSTSAGSVSSESKLGDVTGAELSDAQKAALARMHAAVGDARDVVASHFHCLAKW